MVHYFGGETYVSFRPIQDRAVPLSVGSRRIRTLCPEDMPLFSLLHAAKHHWSVLRLLVDVALLFGVPADWIAGDARADELAREIFSLLTSPNPSEPPGPPWPWRERFSRSLCPQDRLRYTYDWLIAPTTQEWSMAPLPAWLGWLYPAIRIARLTKKHLWRSPMRPINGHCGA